MKTYNCQAGLLSYQVSLNDQELVVKGRTTTRVARTAILKLGLASAAADRRAVGVPSFEGGRVLLSVGDAEVVLPRGLAGLAVLYESEQGKRRDVAVPFSTRDNDAVALIEELLAQHEDKFVGTGNSAAVRARMGLAGGDMLMGLAIFVAIAIVVGILVYFRVL